MLKIMAQVRGSISVERLIFIKTIDKHTEIDQVNVILFYSLRKHFQIFFYDF